MKIKEDAALDRIRKPAKIGPSDTSDTIADRPGELSSDTDAEEAQLGITDEELQAAEAEDELVKTPPEDD